MNGAALTRAYRATGARVLAALAARLRDLDLAEEAPAETWATAATIWGQAPPRDSAAWLYTVARRKAADLQRRAASPTCCQMSPRSSRWQHSSA